jgi:hypothetical protein
MKNYFFKPGKSAFFFLATTSALLSMFSLDYAKAVPKSLDPATADRVGEVNVQVCVVSDKITILVLPSEYGSSRGGGLVGVLVDAGVDSRRKKDAARIVIPLQEKTADIDFRNLLRDALLPTMKELSWPQIMEVKTTAESVALAPNDVSERSFLAISSTCELSPAAEVLEISTQFALYLKGGFKAAVAGSVAYSSDRIGTTEVNDEAIALWAENDAAAFRQALNQGVAETARMLGLALPYAGGKSAQRPADDLRKMEVRVFRRGRGEFGNEAEPEVISGWPIEAKGNRALIQTKAGAFISFPKSDLVAFIRD